MIIGFKKILIIINIFFAISNLNNQNFFVNKVKEKNIILMQKQNNKNVSNIKLIKLSLNKSLSPEVRTLDLKKVLFFIFLHFFVDENLFVIEFLMILISDEYNFFPHQKKFFFKNRIIQYGIFAHIISKVFAIFDFLVAMINWFYTKKNIIEYGYTINFFGDKIFFKKDEMDKLNSKYIMFFWYRIAYFIFSFLAMFIEIFICIIRNG